MPSKHLTCLLLLALMLSWGSDVRAFNLAAAPPFGARVEVTVVCDSAFFAIHGVETGTKAAGHLADAAAFYAPLGIEIVVKGVHVITDSGEDFIQAVAPEPDGERPTNECLFAFRTEWNMPEYADFRGDINFLISGVDLTDSSIGNAFLAQTCTSLNFGFATSRNGDTFFGDDFMAVSIARHLGFLLGSSNDGGATGCAPDSFIMSQVLNPANLPTAFSTCSLAFFGTYFTSGNPPTCIIAKNDQVSLWVVTGDGASEPLSDGAVDGALAGGALARDDADGVRGRGDLPYPGQQRQ